MPPVASLPPGPSLDRVTQSLLFHRDPLGFLRRQQERHGDVFTLRLAIAGTMVVVADPDAVAAVVDADPQRGHGGEARRRILGMVSPRSVLGADGERHATARGRLAPAFSQQALDRRRPAMAAIAQAHVARWPRRRPFRLLPRLRAMSDEVFVRLVLGVRDEARAQALVAAIGRMIWTPGNPPAALPRRQAGALGAVGARFFDHRKAPVERLLGEELHARRLAGADDEDDSVLSVVLRGSEPPTTADLVDELIPLTM